jgi:hypothetical protein
MNNTKAAVEMALDLKVGQRVIHKLTGITGRIIGTESVNGRNKLTVETPAGRILKGLDRQEFFLAEARL